MTGTDRILCPNCDTENDPGEEACRHCGEPIFGASLNDGELLEPQSERQEARLRRIVLAMFLVIVAVAVIAWLAKG